MSEEWKQGYAEGFSDGYNKAKRDLQTPYKQQDLSKFGIDINNHGSTCHVCGLFFEHGKTYGYVCPHDKCPGKITCNTGQPYNSLWSSAMTASVIKDPGPSDGMSYEEIYGSVVYQQNNKKEE
jgi:hypothetical protein